jgi:hypothetical protein
VERTLLNGANGFFNKAREKLVMLLLKKARRINLARIQENFLFFFFFLP